MERRIQAFEFRCLRRVLKVPYIEHRTNISIREEITSIIGLHDPLLTIVKKRKMQFYGHTKIEQATLRRLSCRGQWMASGEEEGPVPHG